MSTFPTNIPWVTRFAPSPTGVIHLGNLRAAVLNFFLAQQSGGKFLLRMEDTDQERSSFAAEASILWSLAWLGLTPHEPVRHQSLRLALYTQAVQELVDQGLAYPCFCSPEDLERERLVAASKGLPPRYSGLCAGLEAQESARRVAQGENHVLRLRIGTPREIKFTDLIKGPVSIPTTAFGDFVLLRSNGWPSYNLAVVVDDVHMGVNLVLRGEDHLTNTARQILLYQAMEQPLPAFAHHGLLVDSQGHKLSKRSGALSIVDCMHLGWEPLAVVQYLASLSGALPTQKQFSTMDEMVAAFNPSALGRGNAVVNLDDLQGLSTRIFRAKDPGLHLEDVDKSLDAQNPWHTFDAQRRLTIITALRENATNITELKALLPFFTQKEVSFTPEILMDLREHQVVLTALAQALTSCPEHSFLSALDAQGLLGRVSAATKVKGRFLYQPIRWALTGSDQGPELGALLTLLSVEQIMQRLNALLNIFTQCKEKD